MVAMSMGDEARRLYETSQREAARRDENRLRWKRDLEELAHEFADAATSDGVPFDENGPKWRSGHWIVGVPTHWVGAYFSQTYVGIQPDGGLLFRVRAPGTQGHSAKRLRPFADSDVPTEVDASREVIREELVRLLASKMERARS